MDAKSIDEYREEARKLLSKLRTERDELNLKMHLAGAEIRDEWQKLEDKWEHFQGRAHAVGETAGEAGKDVGIALSSLGEELRHGYDRVRKTMKQ